VFELNDIHGRILYRSQTAKTWHGALVEAVSSGTALPAINLDNKDLAGLDLARINAPGASCRGTHFRNCNLQAAVMPRSDFTGANLGEADAAEADFRGSDFSQAQLVAINMPKALLDGIRGKGLQACNAILDYSSFKGADLPAINLNEASMLSTDWTNAKLLAANLNQVQAMRSRLDNVVGERAKFTNADLRWSSISGNFTFANFHGANLTAVTLVGDLTLQGATFEAAQGVGPNTHAEAVHQHLQERTRGMKHPPTNKPSLASTQ
jgi:uncharacterized protein YjbI with pentapeptide repeats